MKILTITLLALFTSFFGYLALTSLNSAVAIISAIYAGLTVWALVSVITENEEKNEYRIETPVDYIRPSIKEPSFKSKVKVEKKRISKVSKI
jgi:hypothetical protein